MRSFFQSARSVHCEVKRLDKLHVVLFSKHFTAQGWAGPGSGQEGGATQGSPQLCEYFLRAKVQKMFLAAQYQGELIFLRRSEGQALSSVHPPLVHSRSTLQQKITDKRSSLSPVTTSFQVNLSSETEARFKQKYTSAQRLFFVCGSERIQENQATPLPLLTSNNFLSLTLFSAEGGVKLSQLFAFLVNFTNVLQSFHRTIGAHISV